MLLIACNIGQSKQSMGASIELSRVLCQTTKENTGELRRKTGYHQGTKAQWSQYQLGCKYPNLHPFSVEQQVHT